jgi:mRNA-degrading endonuclease RelE of RelBE toxin-antitoxin system
VKIEWSEAARASARRYMGDQDGMHAIAAAVRALAVDPNPSDAFARGSYRRLRVGGYRVMCVVEGDVVTVERLDRVI